MPFDNGHEKVGGRKKGSPNRTNRDLKSRIMEIVENGFETIENDLEALEAKDRINAYLKLAEFVLAKEKVTKIDLGSLNDSEIEALLDRALNKLQ